MRIAAAGVAAVRGQFHRIHDPLHHPPPALRDTHPRRDQLHRIRAPRSRPQRPDRAAPAHHPARGARPDPRVPRARAALPRALLQVGGTVLHQRAAQHRRAGIRGGDRRFERAPPGTLLGDSKSGGGSHRRADAADAVGGGALLHRGDPHRHPHRHHLRLPGVLMVRPGRHLRVHGGVLGTDLLHRAARDHHLQRNAAVAAVHLRHHPPGDGPRELLGALEAARDAGAGAGAFQRGTTEPLHALRDARQPEPRLRAHRSRQGHARTGGAASSTCCATA